MSKFSRSNRQTIQTQLDSFNHDPLSHTNGGVNRLERRIIAKKRRLRKINPVAGGKYEQ